MKKTYEWTGSRGNKFKLEAECQTTLADNIIYLDGDETISGKKIVTKANLIATADQKEIDTCRNTYFWEVIEVQKGLCQIRGISQIAFPSEKAEEIQQFLSNIVEESKTEEVKNFETKIIQQEKEREIREAKEIIAKAEKQQSIPTYKEARAWQRNYNNLHNEGGDGYVPEIINKEQYNRALEILSK